MLHKLADAVSTYPAIDNHCHNLLKGEKDPEFPLEHCVVESSGKAADDSQFTVASMRATKQLAALYFCEPVWPSIVSARKQLLYKTVCSTCFEPSGIQCLLLDDLMVGIGENCQATSEHNYLTPSPPKRIIRIESVAEIVFVTQFSTLTNVLEDDPDLLSLYSSFVHAFVTQIESHCDNAEVVGFKSISCYRGGLDVIPGLNQEAAFPAFIKALCEFSKLPLPSSGQKRWFRLEHGALNHTLLCRALQLAGQCSKPVQFHTGLGDLDIPFIKSRPALLQPLFRAYPDTIFVILHSSYPFTQEAGYLASMHKNVYLDFGEVWPFVSASGQRNVVSQMLELCPTNKLLWSTDGHYWPETFYLGALQSRQALYEVLSDMVDRRDLTEDEAVDIVERVLFHNSNDLYNLGLTPLSKNTRSKLAIDVTSKHGVREK